MSVPQVVSAAQYNLHQLAAFVTGSFEGYFYPGTTSADELSQRIRLEQIDLGLSRVLLADGQPAGIALLARRGDRVWCGGFGVYAAWRGQGLAHTLAQAMINEARNAGAARLELEVLTRNDAAVRTYERAGLRTQRELFVYRWQQPEDAPAGAHGSAEPCDVGTLLDHFTALHPVPAAWQRDLPSLLVREGMRGLALRADTAVIGYVLYSGDARLRLHDLAARNVNTARALLQALQAYGDMVVSVNEPSDSSLTPAFVETGFVETDRQYDMAVELLSVSSAEARFRV